MMSSEHVDHQEVSTGDGETTVRDHKGDLRGVVVETDGTNDATVECYDGDQASGTKIFSATIRAGADSKDFNLPGRGKPFASLNVVVTGTGASAHVYHSRG